MQKHSDDELFKRALLPKSKTTNDYVGPLIQKYQLLDQLQFAGPTVHALFNYATLKLDYLSPGIEGLTGYSRAEFINFPDPFLYFFHPEDLPIYNQYIFLKLREIRKLYHEDILNLSYQLYGRLLRKDGNLSQVLFQFRVLQVDNDLNPMISFGSITDITSSRDISGITLSVFKEQGDRNDLVFTTKYPFRKVRFSKRELEVLELLAQGQTSKDIAKHLYISDKTVNNHRQKMLKKMGVKSTSALISQASKLDLL